MPGKVSQESVRYRPAVITARRRCHTCTMLRKTSGRGVECTHVVSTPARITRDGDCNDYEAT